ncbi:MAG: four helix bundle protein [candidate division NC10 bacterium]|nr:four helix bundle protein [candidate division NC10 bacterium]
MRSVEDLDVFKLAHRLALDVYRVTESFPKAEQFGLTAQLRKAACSAPSNLVEGANRNSRAEYRSFAGIARGSAGEAGYHLLLAMDLGYLSREIGVKLRADYARVLQMLTNLIKSLGRQRG